MIRTLGKVLAVLALAMFVGAAAVQADDKANTHTGTFVKGDRTTLVMKDKEGKEHTHALADNAKISIDGKDSTIRDLKEGDHITVTVENNKVVKVEKKQNTPK